MRRTRARRASRRVGVLRARSCSPRRDCSTAGARRRTGRSCAALASATRRSASRPTRSSCATASTGAPRASARAWTSRSRWSSRTTGRDLALTVARWLVLFLKRPGGQSQFSAELAAQTTEHDAIRALQAWAQAEPRPRDLGVAALAQRAAMSPRNFARVFAREVGETPARWVERARVEAARRRLEETRARRRRDRRALRLRQRREPAARVPAPRARFARRVPRTLPLRGGLSRIRQPKGERAWASRPES